MCGHHKATFTPTYQPADLLLSVGGRTSRGFDHSGGLIICQFLDASLTSYNVTHLEGVNPECHWELNFKIDLNSEYMALLE